jgi:hypothetical protein
MRGLAAPHHGTTTTLSPPSAATGGAVATARRTQTASIPPGDTLSPPSAIPVAPPSPRVSLDPALNRHGAVDGGWWPHSRKALTELPGLIAALDSRPGVRVQRLSVHRDDWDEIPHRLTADQGRVIRVDWFTTIPRHTVSVTAAGKEPIVLLVVPTGTAEGTAHAPGPDQRGGHGVMLRAAGHVFTFTGATVNLGSDGERPVRD